MKDDWSGSRGLGKFLVLMGSVNGIFLIGVSVLASYYAYFANRSSLQVSNFIKKTILFTLSTIAYAFAAPPLTWEELLMRQNHCTMRIIRSFATGVAFLVTACYIYRVLKQKSDSSSFKRKGAV